MDCTMIAFRDMTPSIFVYIHKVQNNISSKRRFPEHRDWLFDSISAPSLVFCNIKLEYVISNRTCCVNNLLLKQQSVSGDKSKLLTQNVLLLQKGMEKNMKTLKEKMKKTLQEERERHRTELKNMKVRFPTPITNVCNSTFIHPSALSCPHTPYTSSHHHKLFLAFQQQQFYLFCFENTKSCIKPRNKSKIGILEFSE